MLDIPLALQNPVGAIFGGLWGHDILQMIIHAGMMVKFILLTLLGFSVACWTIIFIKSRLIHRAKRETEIFQNLFLQTTDLKKIYVLSKDLEASPVARLFRSGYGEFQRMRKLQTTSDAESQKGSVKSTSAIRSQQVMMENLERSLQKAMVDQIDRLEQAVSFLATTGNTAPFIGLFGTVWGIMQSFRGIGLKGSASLAVVAPGISEALIATAAGLAAAIPAVVAYNYFSQKITRFGAEMDIFRSDFLSTFGRQFFKKQGELKSEKV